MLNISKCDVLGFDMDHTLCCYNLPAQTELCHQSIGQYLVSDKKYCESLLLPALDEDLAYGGGLVFDVRHGILVKLDENGTVEHARLGVKFLSQAEINHFYPNEKWDLFSQIQEGCLSVPGVYHMTDSNFDISYLTVLSRLKNKVLCDPVHERCENTVNNYNKMLQDFNAALNSSWHPDSYEKGTSQFFESVKAHPDKYLKKCSITVKSWLKNLKESGKVLFLLTSSHCDYAQFVMSYCLGEDWRKFFDIVITKAKKPRFFNDTYPFKEIDVKHLLETENDCPSLQRGGWYSQGNCNELSKHLKEWTNMSEPNIVYFGDSLRSDIVPARKHWQWNTVFVMDALRIHEDAQFMLHQDEKSLLFSDLWGPVLSCNKSCPMSSFFARLVSSFATIAVPSIDDVAVQNKSYEFSGFSSPVCMKGFFPGCSEILWK